MATTTTNLGLTKPAGTDDVDIAVINANMDKIDTNIYVLNNNQAAFNGGGLANAVSTNVQSITVPSSPVECNYLLSIWNPIGNGGLHLVTKLNSSLLIKEIVAPIGLTSITSSGLVITANYSNVAYRKWSLIRIGF